MSDKFPVGVVVGVALGLVLALVLELVFPDKRLEKAGAVEKCVEIGERKVCETVCPSVEWKVKP